MIENTSEKQDAANREPLANQVNEACRRLGISRNLLYDMIKAGQLTAIKLGHRTLIPESELVRLVANARKVA